MDWLEKLLEGVENRASIIEGVKKELPMHFVSKEQYDKKVTALDTTATELEATQGKLTETGVELEKLSGLAGENEELKLASGKAMADLEQFKSEAGERESKISFDYEVSDAIKSKLISEKLNPEALDDAMNWFDRSKITKLEDGGFDGIDSQLTAKKETKPSFFGSTTIADPNGEPVGGGAIAPDDNLDAYFGL